MLTANIDLKKKEFTLIGYEGGIIRKPISIIGNPNGNHIYFHSTDVKLKIILTKKDCECLHDIPEEEASK